MLFPFCEWLGKGINDSRHHRLTTYHIFPFDILPVNRLWLAGDRKWKTHVTDRHTIGVQEIVTHGIFNDIGGSSAHGRYLIIVL